MGGAGSGRKTLRSVFWDLIEQYEDCIRKLRRGEIGPDEFNDFLDEKKKELSRMEQDGQLAIDKERKKNADK